MDVQLVKLLIDDVVGAWISSIMRALPFPSSNRSGSYGHASESMKKRLKFSTVRTVLFSTLDDVLSGLMSAYKKVRSSLSAAKSPAFRTRMVFYPLQKRSPRQSIEFSTKMPANPSSSTTTLSFGSYTR